MKHWYGRPLNIVLSGSNLVSSEELGVYHRNLDLFLNLWDDRSGTMLLDIKLNKVHSRLDN
jgi:hypothetical protein